MIRLSFISLIALASCAAPISDEEEAIGSDTSALQIDNALSPNALSPNALSPNALSPNALSPNALSPNALSPAALASIRSTDPAGAMSRMLLKYTVGCALRSDQSFSFSWEDADGVHDETYPGLLGIAPEWATGPINLSGQRLVSACLAARTNWYGQRVEISMRYSNGLLPIVVETSERVLFYPYVEGAFWGNLFAETPYLRACYVEGNVARSRAAKRVCAAGHVGDGNEAEQCGMIDIVGPCSDHCSAPALIPGLLGAVGRYYAECVDPVHGSTRAAITTALP